MNSKQTTMRTRMIPLIILSMAIVLLGGIGKPAKAADAWDTAPTLNMDGQWSKDYWLTDDNAHYYKIVIPADGDFSFKFMSYMRYWCYYELYSSDMSKQYWDKTVYSGSETSPTSSSYNASLSKGTYILKIHADDTGRYRMWATYKNHHVNDGNAVSYDSPQNFTMGSTITGALTESDREDWYRIKVPKTGYYTLFCKSYIDYTLFYELYSSDLLNTIIDSTIYGGDETNPGTRKHDLVLKAGTYYIKVTAGSYTGKYILTWDSLKQKNCSHSYQEKVVWPTYSARGYTLHTCEKCGKKYKDNYVAKKTLGKVDISAFSSYGAKGKIYLQWYTVSDASGYQIRYCRSKTMNGNVATRRIKGRLKNKCTLKKLGRKKKYYIQIRAYKKAGAKTVYGKWSSKKCIKTK